MERVNAWTFSNSEIWKYRSKNNFCNSSLSLSLKSHEPLSMGATETAAFNTLSRPVTLWGSQRLSVACLRRFASAFSFLVACSFAITDKHWLYAVKSPFTRLTSVAMACPLASSDRWVRHSMTMGKLAVLSLLIIFSADPPTAEGEQSALIKLKWLWYTRVVVYPPVPLALALIPALASAFKSAESPAVAWMVNSLFAIDAFVTLGTASWTFCGTTPKSFK